MRTLTFLSGVLNFCPLILVLFETLGGYPDNTGRGCILRLILRRAIRFLEEKFKAPAFLFEQLVDRVIELLGDAFPELRTNPAHVKQVLHEEETSFRKTLVWLAASIFLLLRLCDALMFRLEVKSSSKS